ncbi:MAG: UV DNA damage repair endonuclease UvsE [Chloroherpetonaceae bacterium]|nr:UV DNA damage repair endonuclease UvsE [Chthonomonadaceae bacterium]MDW8207792.1 UV DNA damage repair endonuclease UvsE [Chloroherpetonaceae bacterium]
MRIGFAVKVLGEGGLKECDTRRWQSGPHLRHSIALLHRVFEYLDRVDIRMYRMSSDIAPYLTHPELPQFHQQIEESLEELAVLGAKARQYDLRLSFHPSQYVVLNAEDETVAEKSIRELNAQAQILEAMGLGPEAVVVTHVGGAYGNKTAGIERFARRYACLPEVTRRRLVVENDDTIYCVADTLEVHRLCGIRVVFDNLHHLCNNPVEKRLSLRDALAGALDTWPAGVIPKIHYSSPRTESMQGARRSGKASAMQHYGAAPDLRLHADYINPFEFLYFMERAAGLRPFDVMLESKAKDLAVLKLREDLQRYGPGPL